jgi:hypothetical protein
LCFTSWFSPRGFFVFHLVPFAQIARLPPEEAYVKGDYAFSVTGGWLFWSMTYCFGEHRRGRA